MSTTVWVTINSVYCANCGVLFGITEDFEDRRRKDHVGFFCPKGHSNYFSGDSKMERELKVAQKQIKQAQHEADTQRKQAQYARADARRQKLLTSAQKGLHTKAQKKLARVKNGVCPCCKRSFKNLKRHMTSKHKGWQA